MPCVSSAAPGFTSHHPIIAAYPLDMSSPVSPSSAAAPAAEMPFPEFLKGPYALAMTETPPETTASNNTGTTTHDSAVLEESPSEDAVPLWVQERQREQAICISTD